MHQTEIATILRRLCEQQGILLQTFSDDWLLRMSKGDSTHLVLGQSFDINAQSRSAIANDKVAASILLRDADINCVNHILLARNGIRARSEDQLTRDLESGPVVLKPLVGHSGNDVRLISSLAQAKQVIAESHVTTWAYSRYRSIESEYRIVVLDGHIQLMLKKINPVDIEGLVLYNLSQGATAVSVNGGGLPGRATELALEAMRVIGLRMAAVDVIVSDKGTVEVLEVNATFSLMRYAKTNDTAYKEVVSFYDRLLQTMFTTTS